MPRIQVQYARTVVDLGGALAAVATYLGPDADAARAKLAALDPLRVEVLLAEVGGEAADALTEIEAVLAKLEPSETA